MKNDEFFKHGLRIVKYPLVKDWEFDLSHLCFIFTSMRLVRESLKDWVRKTLYPVDSEEKADNAELPIAIRLDEALEHLSYAESELETAWNLEQEYARENQRKVR